MAPHHFLVGTFDTPKIYTLRFDDESDTLTVARQSPATSAHSWLALNASRSRLYATEWKNPPGIAAYAILSNERGAPGVQYLNSIAVNDRSGYVCCSETCVYSVGGRSGDTLALAADGSLKNHLQTVSFVDSQHHQDDGTVMDFGGLRHGAHGADLSCDGKVLFVPDIGRNCIWCMTVDQDTGKVSPASQCMAPRSDDGPRHVWPHPSGRVLYCLQEHSSMIDVFAIDGPHLTHLEGASIIPEELHKSSFWGDEVRLSKNAQTLFASTRGLDVGTRGWVAAWALDAGGRLHRGAHAQPVARWQTPTSGGWANAIEPAPWTTDGITSYLALTDSEEGLVMIIKWNGRDFTEVARVRLDGSAGAATAVWLD